MFGLFKRPKLTARFEPEHAHSDEFAREIAVVGRLSLANDGGDAELTAVEIVVIAGFRRIPLEVPSEWQAPRIGAGAAHTGTVSWSLTLDAPLRAENGELYLSVRDQRRTKWEWRLPFTFEQR